jgi:hypothetical protein
MGITPNHDLHNDMIQACKSNCGEHTIIDKEIVQVPKEKRKTTLIPDALLEDIAFECQTVPLKNLEKMKRYRNIYSYLIVCLPIPHEADEIWLYDIDYKMMAHKIINTQHAEPIVQLSLNRKILDPADYKLDEHSVLMERYYAMLSYYIPPSDAMELARSSEGIDSIKLKAKILMQKLLANNRENLRTALDVCEKRRGKPNA